MGSVGHDAGDTVLREVGKTLRQSTREGGLAIRYGGEEFLLLIPGADSSQAAVRAGEILTRIESLQAEHKGEQLGPITVSIGVATAPDQCAIQNIVRTADAALLRVALQWLHRAL